MWRPPKMAASQWVCGERGVYSSNMINLALPPRYIRAPYSWWTTYFKSNRTVSDVEEGVGQSFTPVGWQSVLGNWQVCGVLAVWAGELPGFCDKLGTQQSQQLQCWSFDTKLVKNRAEACWKMLKEICFDSGWDPRLYTVLWIDAAGSTASGQGIKDSIEAPASSTDCETGTGNQHVKKQHGPRV